jgi:hypothetical protein
MMHENARRMGVKRSTAIPIHIFVAFIVLVSGAYFDWVVVAICAALSKADLCLYVRKMTNDPLTRTLAAILYCATPVVLTVVYLSI